MSNDEVCVGASNIGGKDRVWLHIPAIFCSLLYLLSLRRWNLAFDGECGAIGARDSEAGSIASNLK